MILVYSFHENRDVRTKKLIISYPYENGKQ